MQYIASVQKLEVRSRKFNLKPSSFNLACANAERTPFILQPSPFILAPLPSPLAAFPVRLQKMIIHYLYPPFVVGLIVALPAPVVGVGWLKLPL